MTEKRKGNNGRRVSLTAGACLLAAVTLLLGCSKEPLDAPGGKGSPVLVEFSVAGLEDMLPAAQGIPGTKAALANNTTVRVIAYKQASGNPLQANYVANQAYYWNGSKLMPCSVDANGNKRADVLSQMFIQAGVSYDFYAVMPALPLAEDNKAILATLYELFPDSPYVLPCYLSRPRSGLFCKKPVFSREGHNVSVVDIRNWEEHVRIAETEGDYNTGAYVYQEYVEPTAYSGRYPVIGSWIIGGEAAGIGIRENRMEVTDNLSEFVPHIIG